MNKNIVIEETRVLAEQGNMEAQFHMGMTHMNGIEVSSAGELKVVEHGYSEALEWFTRAAEQGHADAQNNLGLIYRDGKETPQVVYIILYDHEINETNLSPQDYEELFREFGLNSPETFDYLDVAKALSEVQGIDCDKAVDWFIKAVASGSDAAQINLKNMFNT